MKNNEYSGAVTVSVTLILTIILSLILTSIEAARVNTAELLTRRVTSAAMKSVLAEFYRPLYDEYHIFALDAGYGGGFIDKEEIKLRTIKYTECNLDSSYNKFIINNPQLNTISIDGYKTLLTNNGQPFIDSAVDYQKYKLVAGVAESLLDMLGLIEETEAVHSILLKQVETEGKLVIIDEKMQKLMEIIDGVQFEDNMVKKTLFTKKVKPASSFSKRLLTKPASSYNAGINHYELYNALSSRYINVMEIIETMIKEAEGISKYYEKYNDLINAERRLEEKVTDLYYKLTCLIELNNDELLKEQAADLRSQIAGTESELSALAKQRNNLEKAYKKSKKSYQEAVERLSNLNIACRAKCIEALNVISSIREFQKNAESDVKSFQDILTSSKDSVSDDIYQDFSDSASRMEGYISTDSSSLSVNLLEAEKILSMQKDIISDVDYKSYKNIPAGAAEGKALLNTLYSIKELYAAYPSGLPIIDYTGLNINNKGENNFFRTADALISQEISSLVLDREDLSKASISSSMLPSYSSGIASDMSLSFAGIASSFENSSISSLLSMNTLTDVLSAVKDGAEELLKKILFISYIDDNFADYLSEEYRSVLMYEKEYLIGGNLSDIDNLNSIINKIFMIRFAMNFLHLITDSANRSKAGAAAATIVGFTGFPILINLVKYIILAAWAAEAALVETAAIMKGKKVPLIVTKNSISVAFEEIIAMSKKTIIEKAENIKSSNTGAGYCEYLWIFLLTKPKSKLSFRSMDLIQENIRSLYDDSFYISNCVVSYSVNAEYILSEKFISILNNRQYTFCHKNEISYD